MNDDDDKSLSFEIIKNYQKMQFYLCLTAFVLFCVLSDTIGDNRIWNTFYIKQHLF